MADVVGQIQSKLKLMNKVPEWFNSKAIYMPGRISVEQASSSLTAQYKAGLISGENLLDLTTGIGVDAFFMSGRFEKVVCCEKDPELCKITTYNLEQLGLKHVEVNCIDGLDFLSNCSDQFDWIYIDPSRRHDRKGRVFLLEDCEPNLVDSLDELFGHANNILIKTSPLLDIQEVLRKLKHVKTIHLVALKNEVKELLLELQKGFAGEPEIKTINMIDGRVQKFNFLLSEERTAIAELDQSGKYFFEPNAAVLKAGGFNVVAMRFDLRKIATNSHYYLLDDKMELPGRLFEIVSIIPYNRKALRKSFSGIKANVATRNFPESVDKIRKKLGILDGGELYLFFTCGPSGEKLVFVNRKA